MNKIKQSAPSREEGVTPITFWGTIVMAILLALLASYFASVVIRQLGPLVTYIALAVFLLAPVASVISIVLVINRRQELAAKLAFYATLALGVMSVALFQGRAVSASLSVLVISVVAIGWLFPSQLRRQYVVVTVASMILMWTLEWINPFWRIEMQAAKLGLVAATLFALILGVLVFLQARKAIANSFLSLSLRAKLLSSIVSITGLALLVYGVIFLYRTQQSQGFWSNELQSTVQQQSQQQITSSVQFEANTADQALSKIANAVQQLADYQASLLQQKPFLGEGGYWDANSKLVQRADGQYVNATSDPASIFIPNTTPLSPELIADLNTSIYLDFSAPAVLKQNPNIVAVYYVGANNYTVYYPNIDLASAVPADFDARSQSFYTVAIPENDPERKPVWTNPYQDPAGTGLIVTTSVPVYDQNNQFRGVMSADVQLSKISEQVSTVKLGKSGFAFLLDPAGHIIAMPDAGYKLFGVKPEVVPVGESPKTTILGLSSTDIQNITKKMVSGENGLATATIQNTPYYVAYAPLPVIGYSIGLIAPRAELDAAYLEARTKLGQETQTTRNLSILILVIVLLAASGVSLLLGRFLSTPLTRLTETAKEVAKGNLQVKAEIQTNDEIGTLAFTFNTMTSRLQEILGTLEQRVAARTRNLELAAEVGRAVSQVRALDVLLKDACELILKEFNLYYVQVYLNNPSQTLLQLEAGTGTVGAQLLARNHSLPLNTGSINGRAAIERQSVVISDTTKSATFRQNPLLPETRGEMAVPLMVANKVVGVLDMQSSQPGVLTEEVLPAFEALAGQIAVAIQNANLLAETQEAQAQVEAQARRLVQQGWREHLDAIHKPEQLGFVFDHNQLIPLAKVDESQLTETAQTVSAPIAVTGEALGSLVVEVNNEMRFEQTGELVNVVARQVAQQIENLRLLESAERYRYEAEQAAKLQTLAGWQKYINSRPENSLGYLYDTKEVLPYQESVQTEQSVLVLPLKANDERIGKLAVQGLTDENQDAVDLANAVVERLSAHIENLRLFEETRQGQLELNKRAQDLVAVSDISSASTKELDIQKMLEMVVHLTQRKFGLYHAHVFIYNEQTNLLRIAACGWKEGDEHEGTHGTAAIPLDQEQSLVARAARTRQAVIVNDVHNEPGWLPNPLLPDTQAELAVPLILGDQVLGVLDVQSDRLHAFTAEDASIQTTLASQVATALQNARSFNQAQSALAQSEKLFNASRDLTQATDLQQLVATAITTLNIPAINRAILNTFHYDESGNIESLDVIANWWNGTGHEVTNVGTHYSREIIRAMTMFISPTPVFFNDTLNDERVDEVTLQLVKRLNLRAVAVLPLHSGTTQLGALILEAEEPHNFTVEETRLFTAIAPQIATIMENLRLFDQTQSALAQSEKLFQASRRLTQSESLQDLVLSAVEALDIPEIDRVVLGGLDYTSDGEMSGMTVAANWSKRDDLHATPVGTHYPKEVLSSISLFTSTQPLFFNDMLNDERVDETTQALAKRVNYRAVAALPLYVGSRQDALLLFEGEQTHTFTPEEIRLFTSLAPQLATVLENRRQFERAQTQAKREAMLNTINQKIQSATSVEAVLQIAARELGHALGAPMTVAQLSMKDKAS